jgi:hypothetical protein
MDIIDGDILTFPLGSGAILHSCDISGEMKNNNTTKQISYRFPALHTEHEKIVAEGGDSLLGGFFCHKTELGLIVSLYCEKETMSRKLDYEYFLKSYSSALAYLETLSSPPKIAIPYKIGCGEAGGHWPIVLEILKYSLNSYSNIINIIRNPLEWLRNSEANND